MGGRRLLRLLRLLLAAVPGNGPLQVDVRIIVPKGWRVLIGRLIELVISVQVQRRLCGNGEVPLLLRARGLLAAAAGFQILCCPMLRFVYRGRRGRLYVRMVLLESLGVTRRRCCALRILLRTLGRLRLRCIVCTLLGGWLGVS